MAYRIVTDRLWCGLSLWLSPGNPNPVCFCNGDLKTLHGLILNDGRGTRNDNFLEIMAEY
jgi:hypothetical protein